MIKIIAVGSVKENYLREAIQEYMKRLSKYTNIEIIEVKDEGLLEKDKAMERRFQPVTIDEPTVPEGEFR